MPETATELRELANWTGYDPDLDFRKLADQLTGVARGFRLVDKAVLVGVPHIILSVTYRLGYPRNSVPGDYVSVEAIVADKATLESNPVRHILPTDLSVWGNEPIIYNDSSTGIRRSLTALFQRMGIIDVGPATNKNENAFDKQFQLWANGAERAQDGINADLDGVPFRYLAPRGLRRSDYESPYGPATTFYLG